MKQSFLKYCGECFNRLFPVSLVDTHNIADFLLKYPQLRPVFGQFLAYIIPKYRMINFYIEIDLRLCVDPFFIAEIKDNPLRTLYAILKELYYFKEL